MNLEADVRNIRDIKSINATGRTGLWIYEL